MAKKTAAKRFRRSSRLTLVDGPPNYASSSPSFSLEQHTKYANSLSRMMLPEHNLADPRTMNKRRAAPVTLEEHTAYAHQLMTNSANGLNTQGEDGARNELENHSTMEFRPAAGGSGGGSSEAQSFMTPRPASGDTRTKEHREAKQIESQKPKFLKGFVRRLIAS